MFGPVLTRALARLALVLRSLVKLRFFLWLKCWSRFNHLNLTALQFLQAFAHCLAEDRPTALNLAQAGVAASLGAGRETINALNIVEFFLAQVLDDEDIDVHAGAGEELIDQRYRGRFAPHVLLHELFCLTGLRLV